MSAWGWIPALFALVGAGLAYFGARAGTGQREKQGRREEWGRRFTAALAAIGSPDERPRTFGRVLLATLARSELASHEERQLAERLLFVETRYSPESGDASIFNAESALDDVVVIEDNEDENLGEEHNEH